MESISLDGQDFFKAGESTQFADLVPRNQHGIQGTDRYRIPIDDPRDLFEPLNSLLSRIVYFRSNRLPRIGADNIVGSMAGGDGIITWIEAATHPDPKSSESEQRHNLLKEFETEFADFIGCRSVSLSVPKMENNVDPEINVTLNGRLRLMSQLGSGIAEALILLLIAKLSQQWQTPPVDIMLLEEPELHIHPTLQRKLLVRLSEYGVQLIAATHSPTVVNWFVRNSGRVFRTEFSEREKHTVLQQAQDLREVRTALASIGVSPAEVFLADRVLLVEGPNDIPVYEAFLEKAPSLRGQNVPVLSLGGSTAAGRNFNAKNFAALHPKMWAIVDSECRSPDEGPRQSQLRIKSNLESAGIRCHLTQRRATENYLSPLALANVYGCTISDVDPFEDPNLPIHQFEKRRNGEVALAMEWSDIGDTDLGHLLEDFLKF